MDHFPWLYPYFTFRSFAAASVVTIDAGEAAAAAANAGEPSWNHWDGGKVVLFFVRTHKEDITAGKTSWLKG